MRASVISGLMDSHVMSGDRPEHLQDPTDPRLPVGLLATALDDALRAAQATDGLCDPTIAAALRSAGYDRTFTEIAPGPLGAAVPAGRWREIRLSGPRPASLRKISLEDCPALVVPAALADL